MRHLVATLGLLLLSTSLATAQPVKPVFEGLGMKLTKSTDAMTDAQVCILSVEEGALRVGIQGPSDFGIIPASDKLLFAPDEQHLIRVGADKPVPLTYVKNRNALVVSDPAVAASVLKAIVDGKEVKIRYFDFPDRKYSDVQLKNPNVGYGYQRGVQTCGWKSIGASGELVPPQISVYQSEKNDGYAVARVVGNSDLTLNKDFDKSGGGCHFGVGIPKLFGMKKGQWVFHEVDHSGMTSVVIRDSDGKIEFSAKLPKDYNLKDVFGGNPFPEGEAAVRAAWKLAPTGTVELDPPTRYSKVAMLYGFRELWAWGVQNCGFPPLGQ